MIFKNIDSKYPFCPKTIFKGKHLEHNTYDFTEIKKRLAIKYYEEIKNGLELYIKLPDDNQFIQITNGDYLDIIGTTNKTDELTINIFINDDYFLKHVIQINNTFYKFVKNGNSIIFEKIDYGLNTEIDYKLSLYTNHICMNDIEKYIIGKSIEKLYTGMYIFIGGTSMSDKKINWNMDDRNLSGSSKFRCVMTCNTAKSKASLKLNGLKSEFDLTTMQDLNDTVKSCTQIYKKYINECFLKQLHRYYSNRYSKKCHLKIEFLSQQS